MEEKLPLRVAIIGGGPSGLFMLKRLVESGHQNLSIHIFEKKERLGVGMPYSDEGALAEHVTNVSDNEIPELKYSIAEWVKKNPHEASKFEIDAENFNEYKVLPRLLFGNYLSYQFDELLKKAKALKIPITINTQTQVVDVTYQGDLGEVTVFTAAEQFTFDVASICIGHHWPKSYEDKIPGFYDSPYPPSKLSVDLNHPIAIKGASLTAIDAIRTLARKNGKYSKAENGMVSYKLNPESEHFKIIMHSRNGFLPAVRFHLDDSHLQNEAILTEEEFAAHRQTNGGFLSLDYIFEKDFKNLFIEKDREFYDKIKDASIEEFVAEMVKLREALNPFQLLKAEYTEAEKSIKRQQSVYWKEALGILSFAMNQPAKHFSAEDLLRLKKVLLPLISLVIAYVPQSSCEELLALYDAGVLDLIAVGDDGEVSPVEEGGITYDYKDETGTAQSVYFSTYVNCVGQPHLPFEKFPFKGLMDGKSLCQATYQFQSAAEGLKALTEKPEDVDVIDGQYHLKVSGLAINDHFQIIDKFGAYNPHIYMMAVPYISGYNPDYSGLDFCEAASEKIMESILKEFSVA